MKTLVTTAALVLAGLGAAAPAVASNTSVACKARAHDAVAAMTQHKFEEATRRFSPASKRALPPEKLKAVWDSITTHAGEPNDIGTFTRREVHGYQLLVAMLHFDKGKLAVLVNCDSQNRITTFRFTPKKKL